MGLRDFGSHSLQYCSRCTSYLVDMARWIPCPCPEVLPVLSLTKRRMGFSSVVEVEDMASPVFRVAGPESFVVIVFRPCRRVNNLRTEEYSTAKRVGLVMLSTQRREDSHASLSPRRPQRAQMEHSYRPDYLAGRLSNSTTIPPAPKLHQLWNPCLCLISTTDKASGVPSLLATPFQWPSALTSTP